MISAVEIRKQLQALIESKLALDDFEDWLIQNSWNMHADSDPIAQALASALELRFAEHSDGHLPEAQMLDEFKALVGGRVVINVRLNADPVVHRSGSTLSVEWEKLPAPLAETQPLTVYA